MIRSQALCRSHGLGHTTAMTIYRRPFASHHASARPRPQQHHSLIVGSGSEQSTAAPQLEPWQGAPLPTRMNNIPHSREMRRHFYSEVTNGVLAAVASGDSLRFSVRCVIPELNDQFDVYRAGTLLELVRDMATAMAKDGKRVKVCVQQALGQGVFQGTPLSLSGVMRIMKTMDWGPAADFILTGNLGAKEVEDADAFILIAPQNVTGNTVLPLVEEMTEAAEKAGKPIVTVNAKLGDLPTSGGVMGVRGRAGRIDYVATFLPAYHFRLLYLGAGPYPIMGALRRTWGGPWEVLQRVDVVEEGKPRREEFRVIGSFEEQPDASKITACFQKK